MFEATPSLLRARPQWINFTIRDGQKNPINTQTGKFAKSNDSSTWTTFEEAVAKVEDGTYPYIGYAFSKDDPFFFIDLDEEHPEIFAKLDTYSQKSVSGKGIHLIGIGSFEGTGTHPQSPKIGIFQENRFCLFTADVVENRTTINVVSNDDLQSIHNWVSGGKSYSKSELIELPSTREDEEVYNRCRKRFDSFESLYAGNAGPDHSESDHALISMLCDETESNEQVRSMFCASALCRPHRADNKYIDYSISKTRASQQRMSEVFSVTTLDLEEVEIPETISDVGDRSKIDTMPDGLIKKIADWIWRQAKYPLQEAAVCGSLSIIATIAGRCYQIKGSGLNTWLVLVAGTGTGKNEFQNGIAKVVNAISKKNTLGRGFDQFFNGELASGPAVEDVLGLNPRCFCYFPEFNDIFKKLSNKDAPPHISSLKKALLNSFMISGKGNTLPRRLKAKQKGEDNPYQNPIESPCLVIGGETTPNGMYGNLSPSEIESGFLQRFSIIESDPSSISRRTSPEWGMPFPDDLADELLDFFVHCDQLNHTDMFEMIGFSNTTAEKMLIDYDHNSRDKAIQSENISEAIKEYHTRAGIKASRFAGLFAVAANYHNPQITEEIVEWSTAFVDDSDGKVIERFQSGNVGNGQVKQEAQLLAVIADTLKLGSKKRQRMGISEKVSLNKQVIPHNWLKKQVVGLSSFAEDRNGALVAYERCIGMLITNGVLMRVAPAVAEESYGRGCGAMLGVTKE